MGDIIQPSAVGVGGGVSPNFGNNGHSPAVLVDRLQAMMQNLRGASVPDEPNFIAIPPQQWTLVPLSAAHNGGFLICRTVPEGLFRYRNVRRIDDQPSFYNSYTGYGKRQLCIFPGPGEWWVWNPGSSTALCSYYDCTNTMIAGALISETPGTCIVNTQGEVTLTTGASTQIAAANIDRRSLIITNTHATAVARITYGSTAATNTVGLYLAPAGGSIVIAGELLHGLAVNGTGVTNNSSVYYVEMN